MLPTSEATRKLAQDLVAEYGDDAAAAAAERAEAMQKIGNAEAASVWTAVSEIVARMQGRARRADA